MKEHSQRKIPFQFRILYLILIIIKCYWAILCYFNESIGFYGEQTI